MKMLSLWSVLMFLMAWGVVTWTTSLDSRMDPDLGKPPSGLSLRDAALWSLPLALFVWLFVILATKLLWWAAGRISTK